MLRPGGRAVIVCKQDETSRMKTWMDGLGFSDEGLRELARSVDLYSGPNDLCDLARSHGSQVERSIRIAPSDSHDRVILSFRR